MIKCNFFVVEGDQPFPKDMNRHDDCERLGEISKERSPVRLRIVMRSNNGIGFTAARWASFGWNVIAYANALETLQKLDDVPVPYAPEYFGPIPVNFDADLTAYFVPMKGPSNAEIRALEEELDTVVKRFAAKHNLSVSEPAKVEVSARLDGNDGRWTLSAGRLAQLSDDLSPPLPPASWPPLHSNYQPRR